MRHTQLNKKEKQFFELVDFHPENFKHHNIKAIYSGEKRQPKKGEWYLSGAFIEAYQAKNDLTSIYHIAKLVRVKTEVVEQIEILSEV